MIEAFVDIDDKLTVMYTSLNHVIMYDTFEYDTYLLDKLYTLFSSIVPHKVLVITHGIYDKFIYDNAYKSWQGLVSNECYYGSVSQIDINKLMCVFTAVKIQDIKFYDKISMYQYYLENEQCLVDSNNGSYIIIAKNDVFSKLCYAKSSSLDQTLLQVCRNTHIKDIINFCNYINYDCVKWFENYTDMLEMPIYVKMTTFGFFRFIAPERFFDLNQIKFDAKLETVKYTTPVSEHTSEDNNAKIQTDEGKLYSKQKRSRSLRDLSIGTNITKKVSCVAIIVLLISIIVSTYLGSYYRKKNAEAQISLIQIESEIESVSSRLRILNNKIKYNYVEIIQTLYDFCPSSCVIGNVSFAEQITIVCYVPVEEPIDNFTNSLKGTFILETVDCAGIITLDETNYNKYIVIISM